MIFDYPESGSSRVHGPSGYASCESFRPWLRDEFTFRCVYCLKRETWGQVTGEFELDHFRPQSLAPGLRLDYFNLVYACRRCNAVKLDESVEDPFLILSPESVAIRPDGVIAAATPQATRLIRQLDLNAPRLCKWRVMWMRIVSLAKEQDANLYQQLTGFPDDLPNLGRLRPPQNSRPEGIESSWHSRKLRGLLPSSY